MADLPSKMPGENQDARLKRLERLLEVGRSLSAMLDLEPLLQSIIDAAIELTSSEEASILLYDEERGALEFVAAVWNKQEELRGMRVPIENSIAGEVFTQCRPVVVPDAQTDPRHYRKVDEKIGYKTASLLAVPMIFQGKATGVLTAVNNVNSSHYSQDDIEVLETLASQAAIAIQNAGHLKETKEAFQDLAELDRMKSDFLAITSHELRTPLGLILGHATYLSEDIEDDLKPQMDVIVRSALHLKDIIDDLAKVNNFRSGKSKLRKRTIELASLTKKVMGAFQDLATEKNIEMKCTYPKDALRVEGDEEKIGLALGHLVKNAITFTKHGGAVEIECDAVPGYVKVMVKDNGIGIPKKDLGRIFERFFQVEAHMTRKHGGMGLGLSVAQMMVEMHGGRIGVESEEGKGSVFTLLLPTRPPELGSAKKVLGGE